MDEDKDKKIAYKETKDDKQTKQDKSNKQDQDDSKHQKAKDTVKETRQQEADGPKEGKKSLGKDSLMNMPGSSQDVPMEEEVSYSYS